MGLLTGKTAVVTGSTRGIGRGIALEFAREGARVLLNHRGTGPDAQKDLEETLRELRSISELEPVVCAGDMTVEADVQRLADTAVAKMGKVDVWVNNVGSHIVTPALDLSAEMWERLFRANTTSTFMGCREAARVMLPNGGGSIINISSKMGKIASPTNSCYCAAKAAVIMMTECLAAEWGQTGIRVNVIAPGITLTGPSYDVVEGNPSLEAAIHYRIPMDRFGRPDEMGKTAVFLASDMSSYVTGATIVCDGGWIANGDFIGVPADKLEAWKDEFPRLVRE
jgi:NAD(P)-dependent dehydrogenase (short-subunit alcohol dehydrogenase family)